MSDPQRGEVWWADLGIAGKVRHVLNQDLADLKNCLEDPDALTGSREVASSAH